MARTRGKGSLRGPRPTGRAAPLLDWQTRWAITALVVSTVALWPDAANRWVFPKLVVAGIALVLTCVAPARARLPRWWVVGLLAGGVVLLAAAMLSDAPAAAFWGRFPRYEGFVALPIYALLPWIGARLLGGHDSSRTVRWRHFEVVVSWTAVALAVIAVVEATGARPIPTDAARPGSLTGSATDQGLLGVAIVVILSFTVAREWFRGKHGLVAAAGLASGALAVALSGSRAALVSAIVAVLVVAVFGGVEWWRGRGGAEQLHRLPRRLFAVSGGSLALVAVGALTLPLTRTRLVGGEEVLAGLSDRPLIWSEVRRTLSGQWLFGWGPSGLFDAVGVSHGTDWYENVDPSTSLDSPHNLILQAWGSGGALLVLLAAGLAGVTAVALVKGWLARGEAVSVQALALAAALTAGLMFSVTSLAILVLPLAVLGAAISQEPQRAPRGIAMASSVAAGALALCLAVGLIAEVRLQDGIAAAEAGDVRAAREAFSSAVQLRPWDGDTASIAAQSLAALAESSPDVADTAASLAVEWAEQSLERTPGTVNSWKALAVALDAGGRSEEALVEWQGLAQAYPHDWWTTNRLGLAYARAAQWDDALAELKRGLAFYPENSTLQASLDAVVAAAP